jgi:hypothetical protein
MPDPVAAAAIRAFGAERKYSEASVERWLRLAPADGTALLELARDLRLGENQLRDLWEWAEEIAARDRSPLAHVLASDAIAAARRRPVGRNDKLKLIKGALRRLRFPQLAAVEDRLGTLVHELALPHNVRLTLPEFLEGDAIRIEIVADSPATLRAAAARLNDAAHTRVCELIFELLGEAP